MSLTRGEEADALMTLRLWGKDAQMIICMEELAELTQALAKEMRVSRRSDNSRHAADVDHIAEEMADVEIITNQIRCIFDGELGDGRFQSLIQEHKEAKILRLRGRIDAAEVQRARTAKTEAV